MNESKKDLRFIVRLFYDFQRLRIQAGGRGANASKDEGAVNLSERGLAFLEQQKTDLLALEKRQLKEVERMLKGDPIWEGFFKPIRGIGPAMAGVLLSEVDIHKANTVSALWRYCGLATDPETGRCEGRRKGEKAHFNPWLKAKMVAVMGDNLILANSPYRKFYDDYKHRKKSQLVDRCPACHQNPGDKKCAVCKGKSGPFPWAKSDNHAHYAARRYMVKMLLLDLYTFWREAEGLPVRRPYQEEYLGHVHGAA